MRLLSSAWAGCAASPSGRLGWVGIDPPSPPAFAADSLTAGRTARTTACARPSKLPPMGPARLCGRTLNLPPSSVCLPLRIRNACLLLPPAAARSNRVDAAPAPPPALIRHGGLPDVGLRLDAAPAAPRWPGCLPLSTPCPRPPADNHGRLRRAAPVGRYNNSGMLYRRPDSRSRC